jgi:hypothetical protein
MSSKNSGGIVQSILTYIAEVLIGIILTAILNGLLHIITYLKDEIVDHIRYLIKRARKNRNGNPAAELDITE